MMYSSVLKIIFFTFVLYKTTEAAAYIYPQEDKPEEFADQKGCYLSSLNRVLDIDVPYSPQDGASCKQYLCKANGETQVFTCGVKRVSDGCEEIDGDRCLPYPDCCKIVRCMREDGFYSDF